MTPALFDEKDGLMARVFRLTYDSPRRFIAADVGGWRVSLLLSLFWLQRSQLFLWWDGGASPILRVGPVVITHWRRRCGSW